MSVIVSVQNVRKTYDGGFEALKGASLDIQEGEIIALLGPNGAGKTTLISTICGISSLTSGTITVAGMDIAQDYRKVRAMIGLVPQEIALEPFETVINSVRFSRGLFGKAKNEAYLNDILKTLSLFDKKDSKVMALSGGMKRRVLIAKALAHEPKVLFLDEPTAGVDVELRKDMWNTVAKLKGQGVTIILTTHYLEEAESLCRNIAIIDQGQIVKNTSIRQLLKQLNKETFVLDVAQTVTDCPAIAGYPMVQVDDHSFEVAIEKSQSINALFDKLSAQGIQVLSMRNKSNRLEELFFDLVEKNLQGQDKNLDKAKQKQKEKDHG